jgi:hypothetical protein
MFYATNQKSSVAIFIGNPSPRPDRLLSRDHGTKDRHLREYECLADFADGDAFRCLMQRGLEALNRFAKAFGAEAESLIRQTKTAPPRTAGRLFRNA